ncbi:MAG: hypothetical protein J6Q89_07590, partial [Clostridia bacterium]|nr:hypothetical protein [Clostridia bacterium]
KRLIALKKDGKEEYVDFSLSAFKNAIFACNVDVGASSYWSEISALNTLDSLLKLGKITTVQYLERIPDGLIPDKEKLIEEIRSAEENAEIKGGNNLIETNQQ